MRKSEEEETGGGRAANLMQVTEETFKTGGWNNPDIRNCSCLYRLTWLGKYLISVIGGTEEKNVGLGGG